ncbi:hypothetical protein Gogos_018357, partial [Gossypium gossypioides]|nr:hypothetical protein [Gossypium gossypioides]
MEQPTIEPFMLTRSLVEAESTDLPLTFAFNKTKLVDEEVVDISGVAKSSLINVLRSNHPSSDALEKDNWYTVGDMGVQRAEPQLEPKKHRRQSRKKINQSIVDELNDGDNLDLEIDPI